MSAMYSQMGQGFVYAHVHACMAEGNMFACLSVTPKWCIYSTSV